MGRRISDDFSIDHGEKIIYDNRTRSTNLEDLYIYCMLQWAGNGRRWLWNNRRETWRFGQRVTRSGKWRILNLGPLSLYRQVN